MRTRLYSDTSIPAAFIAAVQACRNPCIVYRMRIYRPYDAVFVDLVQFEAFFKGLQATSLFQVMKAGVGIPTAHESSHASGRRRLPCSATYPCLRSGWAILSKFCWTRLKNWLTVGQPVLRHPSPRHTWFGTPNIVNFFSVALLPSFGSSEIKHLGSRSRDSLKRFTMSAYRKGIQLPSRRLAVYYETWNL